MGSHKYDTSINVAMITTLSYCIVYQCHHVTYFPGRVSSRRLCGKLKKKTLAHITSFNMSMYIFTK